MEGLAVLVFLAFAAVIGGWWSLRAFRTVRSIQSVVSTISGPDIFGGFSREETARLMAEVELVTKAASPDASVAPILDSARFDDPLTSDDISDASRSIYSLAIDNLQAKLTSAPADRALSMKLSLLKARLDEQF